MDSPCLLTLFYDFSVYLISGTYVSNWSISRNYKQIWNSTKISVTPGVYLTWGGSVQRPLTSGPRGWPAGPTLQPLMGWLHGDTLWEAVEVNPMLKVIGDRTPWPTGHMARSAGHHLACYRLNQVGNPSLDPNKYPILVEIKITPHSFCSSPLVNVLVQ
jgi:hypothetical protein